LRLEVRFPGKSAGNALTLATRIGKEKAYLPGPVGKTTKGEVLLPPMFGGA